QRGIEQDLVAALLAAIAQMNVRDAALHEALVEAADALKGLAANRAKPRPECGRPRRGRVMDEGMGKVLVLRHEPGIHRPVVVRAERGRDLWPFVEGTRHPRQPGLRYGDVG